MRNRGEREREREREGRGEKWERKKEIDIMLHTSEFAPSHEAPLFCCSSGLLTIHHKMLNIYKSTCT